MDIPGGINFDERGTSMFTKRFTDVDDTNGVEINLGDYFKEVMIHYEGTQVIATRLGTVEGSEPVNVTADGYTEIFPVIVSAERSLCTVFAPTGQTKNISASAWR